jgi:hypothetical protein
MLQVRGIAECLAARLSVVMIVAAGGVIAAEEKVEYSQVSGILSKYCAGCHSGAEPEGEFSLQTLSSLRAGTPDGAVIEPGQPDRSKLLNLMNGKAEPAMPPEDEPQPTADEVGRIRAWIEQGALGRDSDTTAVPHMQAPALRPASPEHHYVGAACAVGQDRYAVGVLGEVHLKEVQSERVVWKATGLSGKVNSLRASPDGRWVVVGSGVTGLGGQAVLLDARNGNVVRQFLGHNDSVYCASVTADGRFLATGSYDRNVILWDTETGQAVREFAGHNGAIYDLDFDSTGTILATASADQTIKLWRVSDGMRLDTLGQPEGEQRCVRISPDDRYVVGAGADRQIRKWQLVSRERADINPMLVARYAHESDVLQLAFVDAKRLISTSADRSVKLWETGQLTPLASLGELGDAPVGICNWPMGTVAVVTLDGRVTPITASRLNGEPADSHAEHSALVEVARLATDAAVAEPHAYQESEPNSSLAEAIRIELPAEITGVIGEPDASQADQDWFRFSAKPGDEWVFEVNAARSKSPLDSRLEILGDDGQPILRTRLQATRASYFTFRGKDSDTSDDFRLHKWEDMELDEYLYANGEVNRLWLYPRGPDSGFKVYPGFGKRYAFFDSTPLAHALGEPTYVVRELMPGEKALPNGLPVFPIYFENDDDAERELGKDSKLTFVAPEDSDYYLRISDARGFGGAEYRYQLSVRSPRPDFSLKIAGNKMEMPVGSGREWSVTASRSDGLRAPIVVELIGLPAGLVATNPVIIEADQQVALGCIFAAEQVASDAKDSSDVTGEEPTPLATEQKGEEQNGEGKAVYRIRLQARTTVNGREIVKQLTEELEISIVDLAEVQLRLVDAAEPARELSEVTIRPGETIAARLVVDRHGTQGRIGFGKEDSGRNLPHGAFVDNIGLNGLLITEQQSEREFFITAAPKVLPGRRQFHLRSDTKGNPTSRPIWLNVLPAE